MTYDEFRDKLLQASREYEILHNKKLETISELMYFLDQKLSKPKSRGAKSLKGLSF